MLLTAQLDSTQEGHKSEQDRQCVHNVTLNHVHMTVVATEKQ